MKLSIKNAKDKDDDFKIGLLEILAIAMLPAATYGITYTYENAFATSMGIPLGFVEPDKAALIKVVTAALIIITSYAIAVFLIAGLSYLFTKSLKYAFCFAMVVYSLLASATSFAYGYIMHCATTGFILGILTLIVCLIIFMKSYQKPSTEDSSSNQDVKSIINWTRTLWLVISFTVIMFFMLAEVAGKYEAKVSGKYYQLTYQDKPYLMLRTYGSSVILGRYHAPYLTHEIILISKQELQGIPIYPYHGGAPTFKDTSKNN
ncbi:hypothetical protein JD969_13200 [Planctomycetota bacterium]|nr:hypothetical protein JD969_13200 [Planctomycetota bacterium]